MKQNYIKIRSSTRDCRGSDQQRLDLFPSERMGDLSRDVGNGRQKPANLLKHKLFQPVVIWMIISSYMCTTQWWA